MTATRFYCPTCEGNGEVGETAHPDPTQRESMTCATCLGSGEVTLRSLNAAIERGAADPSLTWTLAEVIGAPEPSPTAAFDPWDSWTPPNLTDALATLYGEEEATRLSGMEPPC